MTGRDGEVGSGQPTPAQSGNKAVDKEEEEEEKEEEEDEEKHSGRLCRAFGIALENVQRL